MKKFLLLFSVMLCALSAGAQTSFTEGNFTYTVIGSTSNVAVKAANTDISGDIVIPETVEYDEVTYTVTVLQDNGFENCDKITSITLPKSLKDMGDYTFSRCTSLESLTIPADVNRWSSDFIDDCYSLKSLYILNPDEFFQHSLNGFDDFPTLISNVENTETLNIYMNEDNLTIEGLADAMNELDEVKNGEATATYTSLASLTISSLGYATFSYSEDLDFTDSDVKAYIVSAYVPTGGEVILTRINYVPAGTGIVVKGTQGVHALLTGGDEIILSNMLEANLSATNLSTVSGDNTNYILANGEYGIGFYAIENNTTLAANKAYLPLPTDKLPSSSAGAPARGLRITFNEGDYDGVTGIVDVEESRTQQGKGVCYNLSGQRVECPAKGIYIVDGKKVFIR